MAATTGARAEDLRGRISIDAALPEGQGLVGNAIRSSKPCVSNDFANDARTLPWHALARARNVAAGAALPLLRGGRAFGALVLYSPEKDVFDDELIVWLQRLAENVVHALGDTLAQDIAAALHASGIKPELLELNVGGVKR